MSVLRYFDRFDLARCAVDHFADAMQIGRIYRAAPALYEWLFDSSPPQGGAQVVQGHDHDSNTDFGGIAIPRNAIYSAGYGAGDEYMWEVSVPYGSWIAADYDMPTSGGTPNLYSRSFQLGHQFRGYIDLDLDTTTYPALFAEGYVACRISDSGGQGTLQIQNVDLTTYSAPASLVYDANIQWVPVKEIPIVGDAWNRFLLEYTNDLETDPITIRTYGFVISEVYLAGSQCTPKATAPITQPPATGKPA